MQTCENCSGLVRDLQYIAQQAKLLLPIHDPSPVVWDNIQSALKKEHALTRRKAVVSAQFQLSVLRFPFNTAEVGALKQGSLRDSPVLPRPLWPFVKTDN